MDSFQKGPVYPGSGFMRLCQHGSTSSRGTASRIQRTQIASFVGPTWGPPGDDRTLVGPMLAPRSLLVGYRSVMVHLLAIKYYCANGPSRNHFETKWKYIMFTWNSNTSYVIKRNLIFIIVWHYNNFVNHSCHQTKNCRLAEMLMW